MGCNDSRSEFSEEETIITRLEETIGFKNVESAHADANFHRFSISLQLNSTQFLAATREIQLNMKDFGLIENPLTKFYGNFKKKNGHYDTRKLSALGVILGKGRTSEKASILFKNYDFLISNSLDSIEMKELITDILNISLIIIPNYALDIMKDDSKKVEISKYNKKLAAVLPALLKFYDYILLSDPTTDLQLDVFLKLFKSKEISMLASATKLRTFAIEEHMRVVAPISLVKDYVVEKKKFEKKLKEK